MIKHDQPILPMTGIVLAGGKSSRMGHNKALMEWQGQTLIERTLQVLRSVFSEVLISANDPVLYESLGERIIPDRYLNRGPIGGLYSSLQEAQFEYAFFVACDMPFLSADIIRFLANFTGCNSDRQSSKESESPVVVPDVDRLHPLHAFYPKGCLPLIEKKLKANRLKLLELYGEYPVLTIRKEEFQVFPQIERYFYNVNTPEEWKQIQRFR